MTEGAYLAARTVAPRVADHFARHLDAARQRGQMPVASLPDVRTIEAIIDAAFWASLRREEGYVPKISLAFIAPSQTTHPLIFEQPLAPPRPHSGARRREPGSIWASARTR